MKPKTIENKFTWVPIDKRPSRFGGAKTTFIEPEIRNPLLWLVPDGNDFYLVNLSEEILDSVVINSGGFTGGEDVIAIAGIDNYEYKNIKPKTAVKVEEYDNFYDLDNVLQIDLIIKSKSLGCINIKTYPEKGAANEAVILWDTLEYGKKVIINECKEYDK